MEGVESKALVTGDDSSINPAISIYLEEHVQGFEQCAKEILKLIEEGGSFSEMTAEVYDNKKSKLSTHVTELLRMHRVFVNRMESSDSSSPRVTQMFTPDQKFRTPIGFDVLSSCGGGSYSSRKQGSDSSFSLSSDSDSDSFISTNKLLISPGGDDSLKLKDANQKTVLLQKISALEDEVQTLSHENVSLKHEIEKNESEIKSKNTRFENEKTKAVELAKQVSELKLVIFNANLEIETMGDELNASRKKLDELNMKFDRSMDEISLLKSEHKDDIERLEMEIMEKSRLIDDLNNNFDDLKLTKDGVTAQLDTLRAEKSCQDDLVRELKTRLELLQLEHERVVSSFDNEVKVANELKLKVVELENEVEMQREVMLVRAEEKREAIRQLSFSLEHYMSGYKQLRRAFIVGNRRRTVFSF